MSTLAEIEQAVETLPPREQKTLWQHLTRKLAGSSLAPVRSEAQPARRQQWLNELRQLRQRNRTDQAGAPLQEVLDELRGGRS